MKRTAPHLARRLSQAGKVSDHMMVASQKPVPSSAIPFLVSASDHPHGLVITEELGLVRGESTFSSSVPVDLAMKVAGFLGMSLEAYAKNMKIAHEASVAKMRMRAEDLGANGVVGFRAIMQPITDPIVWSSSFVLCQCYGSAVILHDYPNRSGNRMPLKRVIA